MIHDFSRCPKCGSANISAQSPHFNPQGTELKANCYCHSCQARWVTLYQAIEYMRLQASDGNLLDRLPQPARPAGEITAAKRPYAEHELVRTTITITEADVTVPEGTVGTVVSVHRGGEGYSIEVPCPTVDNPSVVTAFAWQLEDAPAVPSPAVMRAAHEVTVNEAIANLQTRVTDLENTNRDMKTSLDNLHGRLARLERS